MTTIFWYRAEEDRGILNDYYFLVYIYIHIFALSSSQIIVSFTEV